jgi:2-polyprenyl-3-methyl-5-hydroxy-6-metoxy-1,4-benzoquinol methylase
MHINKKMSRTAKIIILFIHALIGWAVCGAIVGVGRQFTTIERTLVIHLIGAPLVFAALSFYYFRRFGFMNPIRTATVFALTVIGLDLFLVAPFFEKSYAMFASLIGTWLPFLLIFISTYLTGALVTRKKRRVCPVERAGSLDNRIRRWFQDPQKILKPYINEGMTVMDVGCGPGFFSIDIAQMVGKSGRVIAADLQEGMLQKLRDKIRGTELEERIILHKCEENKIGASVNVDFVLAFYMVHEVPNQKEFLEEIKSILKPNGRILVVEPPFHVSRTAFEETLRKAREIGFTVAKGPEVFLGKTAILKKGSN